MNTEAIERDARLHHLSGELIELIREWMEDSVDWEIIESNDPEAAALFIEEINPKQWNDLADRLERKLRED